MQKYSRIVLFVLLLTASGLATAAESLVPHAAEYKVKISVLGGILSTRVEATETGYFAESSIEATGMSRIIAHGSIRENSIISLSEAGLRPQRFRSTDTLTKDAQDVDLTFDWAQGSVGGLIGGAEFEADLADNTHDRVSLQYGLMQDLLSGIERDEYALQDAERLKLLSITNVGKKTVTVPFGTFEAIGIQHRAENSSRTTTLWCVEELGFLPVIIEQHRKGKRQMRALLTSYTPL
jgi:hypothetical protein